MDWVKQNGIVLGIGVVGLGMLIYGLWGQLMPEQASVEIVRGGASNIGNNNIVMSESQVVVDVAGAVEKPGVYKLPVDSRIGDALVMAGGLAGEADREWVAATLNLAEPVKDGGKVYIPYRDEKRNIGNSNTLIAEKQKNGKVNINTASEGELDTLVGIGEVRAQAIIANRPYGDIEELVSKAKIPQSVYEKIRDNISVY